MFQVTWLFLTYEGVLFQQSHTKYVYGIDFMTFQDVKYERIH